jgi:hypothetical protein
MVHKRVIAPTRTSSLIGKLDRPHAYQFIDRVLNGAQAGALVLDKLALLVLSTNRFQYIPFQYIPRVLAVLVGVRSGATFDEQISIHPISIHPTSSCRARWRR